MRYYRRPGESQEREFRIHQVERPDRGGRQYWVNCPAAARDPVTRRYIPQRFTSMESEEALVRRMEEMARNNSFPLACCRRTLQEYAECLYERRKGKRTRLISKEAVRDLIALFGTVRVNEVTSARAMEMVQKLDQQEWHYGRKNEVLKLLREISRDGCECHVMGNHFADLTLRPPVWEQLDILNDQEVGLIRKEAEEHPDDPAALFLVIMLELATRVGEGRGLTVCSMNEERRTVRIHQELVEEKGSPGYRIVPRTKNNRSRRIEAEGSVVQWLNRAEELVQQYREAAGESWKGAEEPEEQLLFVDEKGVPIPAEMLTARLRQILQGCEHEGAKLGILRRTGATLTYENHHGNRWILQRKLGDESWPNVLRHYLITRESHRTEVQEKLNNWMKEMIRRAGEDADDCARVGGPMV